MGKKKLKHEVFRLTAANIGLRLRLDSILAENLAFTKELSRCLQTAHMRNDLQTADRIAKLLDVKSPVEHELEDLK